MRNTEILQRRCRCLQVGLWVLLVFLVVAAGEPAGVIPGVDSGVLKGKGTSPDSTLPPPQPDSLQDSTALDSLEIKAIPLRERGIIFHGILRDSLRKLWWIWGDSGLVAVSSSPDSLWREIPTGTTDAFLAGAVSSQGVFFVGGHGSILRFLRPEFPSRAARRDAHWGPDDRS
jgi:hypothetical protein